jgi:hypothetical protein
MENQQLSALREWGSDYRPTIDVRQTVAVYKSRTNNKVSSLIDEAIPLICRVGNSQQYAEITNLWV